jgi:hypothetical protein
MELHDYPFDIQPLSVSIRMACRVCGPFPCTFRQGQKFDERASKCIVLRPNGIEPIQHEYAIGSKVNIAIDEISDKDHGCPVLKIVLVAARRPQYALYNVAMPTCTVALMSFTQFLIPTEDVNTRLSISLSLTLTAAAYKSAIADMTPNVPYLTVLDKYVLMCGLFIALTVFEGAALGKISTHSDLQHIAYTLDSVLGVVILLAFFVANMYFGWRGKHMSAAGFEKWEDIDSEYREELLRNRLPASSSFRRKQTHRKIPSGSP